MEDSMFDEQFVTTAEEIKEAREALIELGKDSARRGNEVKLWQAQIAYTQMFAKMQTSQPGDDEVTKEYEAANRRLFSLFEKGWKAEDRLLCRCYWEFTKRLVYHHGADS
jgi:hypothetical protein